MTLLCHVCRHALTTRITARRGAHSACLVAAAPPLGARVQKVLMALGAGTRRIRVVLRSTRLDYLLGLAVATRHHRRSVVGRCWIELSAEPAHV